uniref:Headcase N-terminal domain-containing protein n=1 Tax=Anopheles culicifacies TaxID=139723 RepID=A0A182M215_9DIPT
MAPLRTGRTTVSEGLIQHPPSLNQTSITSIGGGVYDPFSWGMSGDSDHGFESSQSGDGSGSEGAGMVRCCMPIGECMKPKGGNPFSELGAMINLEDLRECVRVQCSNESCTAGQYMHRECFDRWEDEVLAYLKSTARARSWSDKQRQQYVWTKKGYDLVHKMCACKCGLGNLKKDLDWNAPTTATMFGRALVGNGGGGGSVIVGDGTIDVGGMLGPIGGREDETSSIGGSEQSISPIHNQAPSPASIAKLPLTPKSKVELYSERVRFVAIVRGSDGFMNAFRCVCVQPTNWVALSRRGLLRSGVGHSRVAPDMVRNGTYCPGREVL